MKIDLTQTIKDVNGEIAKQRYSSIEEVDGVEKEVTKKEIITLGSIIRDSVLLEFEDPKNIPMEEHIFRYGIFKKINNEKEVELTQDERVFIRKLVAKRYLPIFAGQVFEEV